MSLAIGLRVRQGVVLSSDTRVIRHPQEMNYALNGYSKLRLFGESAAVATTGDVALMARFLDRAEQEGKAFRHDRAISDTVNELEQFFWNSYRQAFPEDWNPKDHLPTTMLFAGCGKFAGREETFLYRVHVNEHFMFRSEPGSAPAGQAIHGGLYYLSRFRRDDMDLKEAAFLTYFCTREVASLDPTVSPVGVELILCAPGGACWASAEWLEEFRLRHENAALQMCNWFSF